LEWSREEITGTAVLIARGTEPNHSVHMTYIASVPSGRGILVYCSPEGFFPSFPFVRFFSILGDFFLWQGCYQSINQSNFYSRLKVQIVQNITNIIKYIENHK